MKPQKPLWIFETAASWKRNAPAITNPDGSYDFTEIFTSLSLFYDDRVIAAGELQSSGSFLSPSVVAGLDVNKFDLRKPTLRGTLASDGPRHWTLPHPTSILILAGYAAHLPRP